MKLNTMKLLSSLLLGVLAFMTAVDAVLLAMSPIWVKSIFRDGYLRIFGGNWGSITIGSPFKTESFMFAFVILSGLVLGALLVENIRLILNIRRGNPFCRRNTLSLRNNAWFCAAQLVLFIAKLIEGPSILTLGCAFIFLLAAMLYLVLADLFHSAALLREDNDLTI